MSALDDLIETHRQALKRRERETAADLIHAYQKIERRLMPEIDKLTKEIAADTNPSVGKRFRLERAEALLKQIKAEMRDYATNTIGPTVQRSKEAAATLGQDHAEQLMLEALGPPPAGVELAFTRLPVQSIETIVGTTRAGPLADLLNLFGEVAAAKAREDLITGLALGYNPRKIARLLQDSLGTNRQRALLIARTETLRAHRESSRQTYLANKHIVQAWVWHAACDERTCATCYALHGTEFPLDTPMSAHPACRCSLIPKTKTWKQLGYANAKETSFSTPSGSSLFAKASAATQQAVLGPTAYAAYKNGDVELTDFIKPVRNRTWGLTYTRGSLSYATSHHH